MMTQRQQHTSIEVAARRTGLEPHTIRRCLRVGLVSRSLTEDDLADLRRVRRLTELEVNLAGVEIIVRMRRRIVELEAELAHLRQHGNREE
jgi:MerR family transcriptional regulator/heat shock protein HspR